MQIHVQSEQQLVSVPSYALVVHESQRGAAIVTRHAVTKKDGRYALEGGTTLERADLERLNRSVSGSSLAFIPEHLLARSEHVLVWWEPAQPRTLHFEGASQDVQALSGQRVPFPALVFMVDGSRLSVFALRENARPGPDTPLMRSPTFNTYATGEVCLGSTVRPDPNDPAPEHAWSEAFFRSTFTHATGAPFLAWEDSYSELLKAARRKRRFPPEALLPGGKTLGSVLRELAARSEP